MADLSKNSIWSDLSSASTDILGPAYSYADNIPSSGSLGVGSDGTFSQISTNSNAIGTYIKTMITGDPPLGNKFFVNTGGVCTAPDGSTQERFTYINNMSTGADLVPKSMSELGSDFNGLIPGIIGDIEGLNPLHLFTALTADSSPPCQCYQCDVSSGPDAKFITTELSPDFDTQNCKPVDISVCVPNTTESFTNYGSNHILNISTAVALGLLVFLNIK